MDSEELTAAVTNNPELAKEFLRYLYPAGVFVSEEGFSIGDFRGTKAKAQDGRGSTYIHIPECTGSDKTTGEKCNGPLSLLRLRNEYSPGEAERELRSWLKTQGVETDDEQGKKTKTEEAPFPWPQLVEGTKRVAWAKLTKFRGYPKGLVARVREHQLVAHDGECFCFPLANKNGVVVGIDRLIAHPLFSTAKKARWVTKPVGVNRHANWFSIGCDVSRATTVIVTESRWDAIAILHYYSDQELKGVAIIGAAGASQVVLPKYVAPVIYAALQNDKASEQWAYELFRKSSVTKTVKCLRPPEGFKDYNDALRAGKLVKPDLDNAPTFTSDAASGKFQQENRPLYVAFGGSITAPTALEKGVRILVDSGKVFNFNGALTALEVGQDPINLQTDESNFNLTYQRLAITAKEERGKIVLSQLGAEATKLLTADWKRSEVVFPHVAKILASPTLLRNGEGLFMPAPGYHPHCHGGAVYIVRAGEPVPDLSFDEAVERAMKWVDAFVFETSSDRTRAVALMLGPAFVDAGFISGEYPMGYIRALFPGAGKTTLMLTIVLYSGEGFSSAVTLKGKDGVGVGSHDSAISAALIKPMRFVTFDNVGDGLFSSSLLASALTGTRRVQIRASYTKELEIDCGDRIFLLTSNGCTLSDELYLRSLVVNLKEAPPRWEYGVTERMDKLKAERAINQGCRNAIVKKWFEQGGPTIDDRRHRFQSFSSVMGGVTEKLIGMGPLLDGVEEAAAVMTDPTVAWAHTLAKWMTREPGYTPQTWYAAKDLEHLCRERGINPPGTRGNEVSGEYKSAIGRTIAKLAKISDPVSAQPFRIYTQSDAIATKDERGRVLRTRSAWWLRIT